MFEATLHAAEPDHSRLQRLTLAALIALGSTSVLLASGWTLERLGIDRVVGPAQHLEILQFSLLPPPPIEAPPPAPAGAASEPESESDSPSPEILEEPEPRTELDATRSHVLTQPSGSGDAIGRAGRGVPTGVGCPAGICSGLGSGDGGSCTGPACGTSMLPPKRDPAPPAEVEFSALRCLACADPDPAALRRAALGVQRRSARVEVKFCVDTAGRVDRGSIEVSRSFGLGAVDRITTTAIERWRFSPLRIAGKPRRACSRAVFNIRFD